MNENQTIDTNYTAYTPKQLAAQKWFRPDLYPFTPHFAKTSFGKMHYVDEGAGIPVVLLHGTPSWSFEYAGVIPELVKAGFRVIAPDFLGFGLSERPSGQAVEKQLASSAGWHAEDESSYYSPAFHRAALVELLSQLNLHSVHIVAHDMSGPVVWPLVTAKAGNDPKEMRGAASAFPSIKSVTLINTWAWSFFGVVPKFEKTAKMLSGGLTRWLYLSAGFSARVLLPKAWGVKVDKTVSQHLSKMMPNRRSRPATYGVVRSLIQPAGAPGVEEVFTSPAPERQPPAQLIWGMKDSLLPEDFISIWQKYPGLQSVHKIAETGHFPQITHPQKVAQLIEEFVQSNSGSTSEHQRQTLKSYAPKVTGKGSQNR